MQPHFYGTRIYSQRLGCFLHAQFFQVSQCENLPVNAGQLRHGNSQRFSQFLPLQGFQRNLPPICQRGGREVPFVTLCLLLKRLLRGPLRLFQSFPPFIDRNGRQPGAELGVPSKGCQMPVRTDHRLLRPILGFRLVLHDRKQRQVHHPLVRPDQLMKQFFLARQDTRDQPRLMCLRRPHIKPYPPSIIHNRLRKPKLSF